MTSGRPNGGSRRSLNAVEDRSELASRRAFLARAGIGVAALGVGGCVSAAGLAAADGRPPSRLRAFDKAQAATYGAWCDVLAIGAARAGVAFFVDKYLAEPFPDSLLLIRYLQNPPFTDFYLDGIAGIDQESEARFSSPFLDLDKTQKETVVDAAVNSTTVAWATPDPNFFYFTSKSDAVDVVYGTVAGFRDLRIPYLAHIRPRRPW
jgi:Gluconate 2-dehydrogenase subunit 3